LLNYFAIKVEHILKYLLILLVRELHPGYKYQLDGCMETY